MDRYAEEPHSRSTPSLVRPFLDGTDEQEERDRSTLYDFLRRDYSENNLASTSHSTHNAPEHYAETPAWLEFLRDPQTGDNETRNRGSISSRRAPGSAGETGEARKRRLTAPDSSGRVGYGPSLTTMAGGSFSGRPSRSASLMNQQPRPPNFGQNFPQSHGPPGSSASTAIDLTDGERSSSRPGPPARQPSVASMGRQSVNSLQSRRRESDLVLPPWQPDSEVTKCPVCQRQFSFYYRKHHCRKCGRVVCGACSPHRITIPRQFIVHPPSPTGSGPNGSYIDLTEDGDDEEYNPALGGGEEVRVCNPCVPDPNYNPPPQPSQTGPNPYNSTPSFNTQGAHPPNRHRNATHSSLDRPAVFTPRHRPSHSDVGHARPDSSRHRSRNHHDAFDETADPFRERPVSYHQRGPLSDLWTPPRLFSGRQGATSPSHTHTSAEQSRAHRHSGSNPGHISASRYRSAFDMNAPLPPLPRARVSASPPLAPRRQIPEEDECPVCGNELPPKGPDGDETAREAHIMECIETSYAPSASAPPAAPSANRPIPGAVDSNAASSTAASSPATGSGSIPGAEGSLTPHRQTSTRRRQTGNRMLVYKATEKDCVGDDGEPQECVICFEEFEEGMEMGRLECWCKFHRACIRKWWETKGVGSCPTHQLHD